MTKFKFKPGAIQEIGTEDPWYALTSGGYLTPREVLEDPKQTAEVEAAVKLVRDFIQACYDEGVIEEV